MKLIIQRLLVAILLVSCYTLAIKSQDDAVLFSIDDKAVGLDEFNYIYKKNNGEKADYSRASVEEYLDLYVKFKLKVHKARQLGMDTIKALNDELAGYRRQLAKSYLVDKELLSSLVEQAYERKQKDLRISHLLLKLDANASKEEELKVYDRILKIKGKIDLGADFKLITQTLSEDKSSSPSGGNLGWMTALLPNGFFEFENAIYNLKLNEVSDPVRTAIGYHLLKLTDVRDARGEMEVSHILVRSKRRGQYIADAKVKIDSLYSLLENGNSFEDLAKQFSEDKNTAAKGGYLGYFGIGQYDLIFENAAFELTVNGEFSKPILTGIGWHIIKRKNKKDYSDEISMKRSLESQISKSDRFEIARKALIERIKKQSGFENYPLVLSSFIDQLDNRFYSYKWEIPDLSNDILLHFGRNNEYSITEFAEYCKQNTRKRMQYNKATPVKTAINDFYEAFIDEKAMVYEEAILEEKYPDFKALMREYAEGILLFEATKIHVWDKAPKDTLGLKKFYENNKDNYTWSERGVLNTFTIASTDKVLLAEIRKKINILSAEDVLAHYNVEQELISYQTESYEKGSQAFIGLKWFEGYTSPPKVFPASKNAEIKKLSAILAPRTKTLDEARGYIVADYQDELESSWVTKLKREFEVKISNEVLEAIIKEN